MTSQTSSAHRLLDILNDAVRRDAAKTANETWAAVFGIPADRRAALLGAIASLHALLDRAKLDVTEHPDLDQRLFLGPLLNIESILNRANLDSQWGQVAGQLQGGNLLALEFVAHSLNQFSDETLIADDELAALRRQIEGVVAEILESDIEATLKHLLVSKLEEARQAIISYRLTGADGLRKAAEAGLGAVMVVRESVGKDADKKGFVDYIKILGDLFDLVEKAKPFVGLIKPMIKALLSSGA